MSNRISNSPRQLIAADIGNSSTKIGIASDTERTENLGSPGWSLTNAQLASELPAGFFPQKPADWWVCSVSPLNLENLQQWLKKNRPADTLRVIGHRDVPIEIQIDSPERVGLDRLVAAYMASIRYPEQDIVVVDAGTAITIDAVSARKFLGGTISPGSRIEFQALLNQTAQLPLIDEQTLPENVIGKSTEQAIRSGVLFGQVGSITYLVEEITKQLNHPKIVATGGGVTLLRNRLPETWDYVPTLVLDGIHEIATVTKT